MYAVTYILFIEYYLAIYISYHVLIVDINFKIHESSIKKSCTIHKGKKVNQKFSSKPKANH